MTLSKPLTQLTFLLNFFDGLQPGIIDGDLHVPMAEKLPGVSLWIAKDKPEQYLQLIPLEPREIA